MGTTSTGHPSVGLLAGDFRIAEQTARETAGRSVPAETATQQDVRPGDRRGGRYRRRGSQCRRHRIRDGRQDCADEQHRGPQFVGAWSQYRCAAFAGEMVRSRAVRVGGMPGSGRGIIRRAGRGGKRVTRWPGGFESRTVLDTQSENDRGEYEHENREDAPLPCGMPHGNEYYAKWRTVFGGFAGSAVVGRRRAQ